MEERMITLETKFDNLNNSIQQFIGAQNQHNKNIAEDISAMKRGLHGDQINSVEGLIVRQQRDEQRLDKIERKISKVQWVGFGVLITINVAWIIIKEFVLK